MILAWVPATDQVHWKSSTDQGATWSSTNIIYREAGHSSYNFNDIHAVQEYGLMIIASGSARGLLYSYSGSSFRFQDDCYGPCSTYRADASTVYTMYGSLYQVFSSGAFGNLYNTTATNIKKGYKSYSIV